LGSDGAVDDVASLEETVTAESVDALEIRATELAAQLVQAGWNAHVQPSEAFAGGGSLPDEKIPSRAVVIQAPWPAGVDSVSDLARRLRQGEPAVVGRVHEDRFRIDLRTVAADESQILVAAIESTRSSRENSASAD